MRAQSNFSIPAAGFLRTIAVAGLMLGGLAGCATPPPASDPDAVAEFKELNDPLEPANRVAYDVNAALDGVILEPAARAYRFVVPAPVRTGLDNVLDNLGTPVKLGNDMLAGKPRRAGDTTMRFLINTTAGMLGFFDVASGLGFQKHDTDFGLTLGSWGVEEGPYLFLPLLGPSSPREITGFAVDQLGDPFNWIGQGTVVQALGWTRFATSAVNAREKVLDPVEQTKKTALDPYATFRSLYRQYRAAQLQKLRDDNRATIPVWFPDRSGQEINPPSR